MKTISQTIHTFIFTAVLWVKACLGVCLNMFNTIITPKTLTYVPIGVYYSKGEGKEGCECECGGQCQC